jgi:hypothetical protein
MGHACQGLCPLRPPLSWSWAEPCNSRCCPQSLGILRKSGFRSLGTKPRDITCDLVECLAPIGRRPIRASVATVSFKSVRTCISFGWLFLLNAGIPPKSYNSLLFSAVGFLPLYTNTNHNDVGVMLIVCNGQCPQLFRVLLPGFVCGDGGSER